MELNNYKKTEKSAILGTLPKISLIFLILIISISFLIPVDLLIARDYRTQKVLNTWKLKEDLFTIAYTHSVMLSEVTETFKCNDNKIILLESTFKDYGAGLPSSTPYDFEIDEETKLFRIYNINEEMSPLVYKTGAVRANHKILVNGIAYEFLSFSEPRESVEFIADKTNYFNYFTRRLVN